MAGMQLSDRALSDSSSIHKALSTIHLHTSNLYKTKKEMNSKVPYHKAQDLHTDIQ